MKKKPIPIGARVKLEQRCGKVTQSNKARVRGVFDDGQPFDWSREGFRKDFTILETRNV